jgi:O-antigen/teichoic acid export membrane protein
LKLPYSQGLNKFNSLQTFQFLRFGTFFLISILLAKIAILYQHEYGMHLIGQYEKLMLVTSSLTFFWVGGITNTLIPYFTNSDPETGKKVMFNAFIILLVFSVLAAISVVIIGRVIGKDVDLYNMFALVVLLNTPTYIVDYMFYLNEKYKSLIKWGVVTFFAQIIMLCLPLYFKQSLTLAINLLLVLSLVKFNYTIILLMKFATVNVNFRLIKDFMIRSMPLMFSILLGGSMEYINSYIIGFYFSEEEFAMFRYGARELPIFLILANSMSNVYSGELARFNQEGQLKQGLTKFKNSSTRLMRWLFPATMVLMFVSPYLFKYAYNDQLIDGYKIFNIYLLLIVSRMIFPQTVIMGMMKSKIFYLISSNYLIINCLLAFWFINLFGGIHGIAYATAISYLIEKIMLATYCKMEGIDFRQYTSIKEYLFYSALTVGVYYLSTQVQFPML